MFSLERMYPLGSWELLPCALYSPLLLADLLPKAPCYPPWDFPLSHFSILIKPSTFPSYVLYCYLYKKPHYLLLRHWAYSPNRIVSRVPTISIYTISTLRNLMHSFWSISRPSLRSWSIIAFYNSFLWTHVEYITLLNNRSFIATCHGFHSGIARIRFSKVFHLMFRRVKQKNNINDRLRNERIINF